MYAIIFLVAIYIVGYLVCKYSFQRLDEIEGNPEKELSNLEKVCIYTPILNLATGLSILLIILLESQEEKK